MGKYASEGESVNFTPAPAGPHVARCFRFIDLGTQHSDFYDKDQEKIMLGFELLDTQMDDGQPFTVFKTYTLSLNEKANLRHDLRGWRGRDFTDEELKQFDVTTVVGAYGQVNVTHKTKQNGDIQARIEAIMPLSKDASKPPPHNENQVLVLEPGEFDKDLFESLSENLRNWIARSPEYRALTGGRTRTASQAPPPADDPAPGNDELDDDIPF